MQLADSNSSLGPASVSRRAAPPWPFAQPRGPSVSPSRLTFQRLTNELPRIFPPLFGHTPVVFHFARMHEKPPKSQAAPTHARGTICKRSLETCVTICHLAFPRSYALPSRLARWYNHPSSPVRVIQKTRRNHAQQTSRTRDIPVSHFRLLYRQRRHANHNG